MSTPSTDLDKSEILFLYESTFSIPNGDPFTGEQRYDEETKRVLVSDVRIKRFIRDFLLERGEEIYVANLGVLNIEREPGDDKKGTASGAGNRVAQLAVAHPDIKDVAVLMQQCIDVKLFGGISTAKEDNPYFKKNKGYKNINANLTGPVQFAMLNPSLNSVDLRMHQNTSVLVSKTENEKGAIATTTVVPYALNQIHGWINPFSARHTNLTQADVDLMFKALWQSINSANTRTKSNQDSLLLLQVVYSEPTRKLYGLDRAIQLTPNADKKQEQIRSADDYTLNFDRLQELAAGDAVKEVRFHTESEKIRASLTGAKFQPMPAI
jgi:CRISPR-associated protein Csh2